MNGQSCRALVAEYVAGELRSVKLQEFLQHSQRCAACQQEIDEECKLTHLLGRAVNLDTPSPLRLLAKFEKQIAKKRSRAYIMRSWGLGAAALLLLAGGLLVSWKWFSANRQVEMLNQDAGHDHKIEISEMQFRHWLTDPQKISVLAQTVGVSDVPSRVAGLELKRGRICSLRGSSFVHLVYGDHPEVSVFVASRDDLANHELARKLDSTGHREQAEGSLYVSVVPVQNLAVVVVGDAGPLTKRFASEVSIEFRQPLLPRTGLINRIWPHKS